MAEKEGGVPMRMKRPQGYKTKRCKHGNKVRFHFRTLHRLKLEVEWPACCDPKGAKEE